MANQPQRMAGVLDGKACEKLTRFVGLCDAYGLPLVSFVDVPGFMIGSRAERDGLARRASRLVLELARATVPIHTVVVRKGYGMGYLAMGGARTMGATTLVAWPTAQVAAMSVEGAAGLLLRDAEPADRAAEVRRLSERTGALAAAEAFAVDDVVLPSETRRLLVEAVATGHRRPVTVRGRRPVPPG
jgi:propionyl-CoA carboxylase beta chain